MKNTEFKIAEAIDRIGQSFMNELNVIMDSVVAGAQILLGYDNMLFGSQYSLIITNLEAVNAFSDAFVSFLRGKEKSFDLFMEEILPLFASSGSIDTLMREKYIEHNNIQVQVTGGTIKRSFFLQGIDFTLDEEILIKSLVELAIKIKSFKIEEYDRDWYDDNESKFVFTEKHKIELKEKFKRYLTTEEFRELVALEVTAFGLNQMLDVGYSLEQLGGDKLRGTALGKNLMIITDPGAIEPLSDGKKGFTRSRKGGPTFCINMDLFLGTITDLTEEEVIVHYIRKDKDGKHLLSINGDTYKLTANAFFMGKAFVDLPTDEDGLINVQSLLDKNQYEAFYKIISYLLKVESDLLEEITIAEQSLSV